MSGGNRLFNGAVKGTGVAIDVKIPGFKPTKVRVFNLTTNIMLEWNEGMADASGVKTIANGTRTLVTSNGITPLASGFRLGTDSVNASADDIRYEAWT